MRRLLYLLPLLVLFCSPTRAQTCSGASPTWTASDASSTAVQACFNKTLSCGDTINIPADTKSWGTQVTLKANIPTGCPAFTGSNSPAITVKGATTCTSSVPGTQVTSCTDNTNITLGNSGSTTFVIGNFGFAPAASLTSFVLVQGITFTDNGASGGGSPGGQAGFTIHGTHGQVGFRLTQIHFVGHNTLAGGAHQVFTPDLGWGLLDHVLWTNTNSGASVTIPIVPIGDSPTAGFRDWAETTNAGTNQAVYIEDSREVADIPSGAEGFFDCYEGAKVVIRNSTFINDQIGGCHGTDSGPFRSAILMEIYNNTLTNSSGNAAGQIYNTRGGTTLFFNNTVGGSTGGWGSVKLQYFRVSQQVGTECGSWGCLGQLDGGGNPIGGLNYLLLSTDPTTTNGRLNTLNASAWAALHSYTAGNSVTFASSNYQATVNCVSGAGTPSGVAVGSTTATDGTCVWFNVAGSTTGGITNGWLNSAPDTQCSTYPTSPCNIAFDSLGGAAGTYPYRDQPGRVGNQVLLPNYEFLNTGAGITPPVFSTDNNPTKSGRDYFDDSSSSCGTVGVCHGLDSGKFSTCSNATYPGPAYWATDTKKLYVCTAANTVTAYYTPYTYPHPFQGSGLPVVTYSPTSISFGGVQIGQSSTATSASIQNTGTATLTVSQFGPTNNKYYVTNNTCGTPATLIFGGATASFSLAVSASCTFSVTYLPQSVNNVDAGGVLAIDNTAGGSDTLILSGIGLTAPTATAQFQ